MKGRVVNILKEFILVFSILFTVISVYCAIFCMKSAFDNVYTPKDMKFERINGNLEDNNFRLYKFNIDEQKEQSETEIEEETEIEIPKILGENPPLSIYIFSHGHKGGYSQILTMARRIKEHSMCIFYGIDFKGYPSAFSADIIRKETEFMSKCIEYLVLEYKETYKVKINIIAHSFGGVVALLALQLPSTPISYIENIITFNTPTHYPPLLISKEFPQIYKELHSPSSYPSPHLLQNISYIQINSGRNDLLVQSEFTSIHNIPLPHKLHLHTNSMYNVFSDFEHNFILRSKSIIDHFVRYFVQTGGVESSNLRLQWAKEHLMGVKFGEFWGSGENIPMTQEVYGWWTPQEEINRFLVQTPNLISSHIMNRIGGHFFLYMNITEYKDKYPLIFTSSLPVGHMEIYVQFYNKSTYILPTNSNSLVHIDFPDDLTMFRLPPNIAKHTQILGLKIWKPERNGKHWFKGHPVIKEWEWGKGWVIHPLVNRENTTLGNTYIYDDSDIYGNCSAQKNNYYDANRLLLPADSHVPDIKTPTIIAPKTPEKSKGPDRVNFYSSDLKKLDPQFTSTYNLSWTQLFLAGVNHHFTSNSLQNNSFSRIRLKIANPFESYLLPIRLEFSSQISKQSGFNEYVKHFLVDRVIINSYLTVSIFIYYICIV